MEMVTPFEINSINQVNSFKEPLLSPNEKKLSMSFLPIKGGEKLIENKIKDNSPTDNKNIRVLCFNILLWIKESFNNDEKVSGLYDFRYHLYYLTSTKSNKFEDILSFFQRQSLDIKSIFDNDQDYIIDFLLANLFFLEKFEFELIEGWFKYN